MTVCLVIPPSGFQLDERVFPMLGVLKVAAVLERAGVPVRVLDLSAPVEVETALAAELARPSDARLLLGGPHVTLTHTALKAEDGRASRALADLREMFDVLVCGDGEHAVFQALEPDAPWLINADNPASTLFLTKSALAASPWPARHLIDLSSYHYQINGVPATSLIGQLGCPFSCGFCGGRNSASFRRVRTRPPSDIVAEMVFLSEHYGYQGFMFLDDELNVSPAFGELLTKIIDAQATHGASWHLRGLVKAELLTQKMADQMRAAGFQQVLSGFESGDDRMLTNMAKRTTVAQNTMACRIAKAAGLEVKALMSIGHPGESAASVEATRCWLLDVQPDAFDVSIITVYPGTPYHDEAVQTGDERWTYTAPKTGDRLHARPVRQFIDEPFYKGVPGAYRSFVETDALTADDLVAARDALETDIRGALDIPWPSSAAELQFEHSMGAR
jgi:anaerobic magnesium-protoporphyrin IX monomethyl ester cyclase